MTNEWEQLPLRGGPSARSGHRYEAEAGPTDDTDDAVATAGNADQPLYLCQHTLTFLTSHMGWRGLQFCWCIILVAAVFHCDHHHIMKA